jgi:branched-chain amino acid transport system ATP-binding protein
MLQVDQVSRSFDSLRAVDNVSLTVPRGQIIGLIGPNGSGKSTLLNLIAGSLQPDSGRILLNGGDITDAHANEVFHLGIARSFQDPSLFFRMSVLDNMLLPAIGQIGERPARAPWHRFWRRQEHEHAQRAAALLGENEMAAHGTKPASDLSGGQMKLVELARSTMGDPKLLLLDEPTAGVAPNLAYDIFQRIARLRAEAGLTFLIVEHRLEILFDFVDSLYVMHLGRILAQGTPEQILQNQEVREIYFGD